MLERDEIVLKLKTCLSEGITPIYNGFTVMKCVMDGSCYLEENIGLSRI